MVQAFAAGGVIVDTVVTADGALRAGSMGGNAVYAAAGMRLWLDQVGIVATVPRNYPAAWLTALVAAGLDTSGIQMVDEDVETTEWFFYRADGSRADGLHAPADAATRLGFAAGPLTAEQALHLETHLRAEPQSGRTFGAFRRDHPIRLQHVQETYRRSLGAHLGANRADAAMEMAAGLHRPGFRLTLDPGGQAAAIAPLLPRLMPHLDAILPSETELALLTPGQPGATGLAALRAAGVPVAAVKMGARGALLDHHGQRTHVPALTVDARDPTGAGDAWCGGFLAGWLQTGDPMAGACCGTVSASFAVEAFGTLPLLQVDRRAAWARLQTLLALLPPDVTPRGLDRLRPQGIPA